MITNSNKVGYARESVAQAVEDIIEHAARWPERHQHWTPEVRAMWAGFPAQVRAYRYPVVRLDPHRPLVEYLRDGTFGPAPVAPAPTSE